MKNTVFTEKHIAFGAKMVPFAGFNMPIQYVGINEEHNTVREGVGAVSYTHLDVYKRQGLQRYSSSASA